MLETRSLLMFLFVKLIGMQETKCASRLISAVSSHEHNALRMSYSDRLSFVVRRQQFACEHYRGHTFGLIFIKHGQNVNLHESLKLGYLW